MAGKQPNNTGHVPKTNFEAKHKVVYFGDVYAAKTNAEQRLYCFRHQRVDLKISEGVIPVNFLSKMWLEEGHPMFLETRCGGWNIEDNLPVGPEYRVSWRKEKETIPPVSANVDSEGWNSSLDELWIAVLSYFERKNLLSEETLDYLDADPFVLFGLDDNVTQQALIKLGKFPALMCDGATPDMDEWRDYLRINRDDTAAEWLVQAMAETELPKPWTCYKGVGSIVCYIRADTGQVTWKHPFYDYFRQLRDFCRQATPEEVMQVRVNRLLWSYEASRIETEHYQEPLIAPEYVQKLATIFGYDVRVEGCIVRNLKAQLKVFAKTYRSTQTIDINDVCQCAETLTRDSEKYVEMKNEWGDSHADSTFDLKELSNGKITCVNCETTALAFCLECKDYLCLECYDTLHQRGARRDHAPFRLVACSLCVTMPAKLHCTFTDKSLCHECYAMKHIKILPPDGKENQPRQIDYKMQYVRYATFAKERRDKAKLRLGGEDDEHYDSVLSLDWHPFYDSRGVKFYHNFLTGERMRQSPRQVPNTADPGAPPEHMVIDEDRDATMKPLMNGTMNGTFNNSASPLTLTGFDSMNSGPKAQKLAAQMPENRSMRSPVRTHMPNEVPVA
jgi:hypothetical protein